MSFRGISKRQEFRVLRTRPRRPSDEKLWTGIYTPQVGRGFDNLRKFAVANWIPTVVGIVAGLGAGALGFYIGQTYSTASIGKKLATKAVGLLPKKIQAQVKQFIT